MSSEMCVALVSSNFSNLILESPGEPEVMDETPQVSSSSASASSDSDSTTEVPSASASTSSDSDSTTEEVKEVCEVTTEEEDEDDCETFKRNWDYSDLLAFIVYAENFGRPFKPEPIDVKFPSKVFDGTWSFGLFKLPRAVLRIKAKYYKINTPIKESFLVSLDVVHKLIRLRCGPRESGVMKMEEECKPKVYTTEECDGQQRLRIQRNVQMKVYSYEMEWFIGDPIIQNLIIEAKQNKNVTFSFTIQGRPTPKKEEE